MAKLIQLQPRASEGERRTADLLRSQLPDEWVVVCNALVVTWGGATHEVDFFVVGDHGVYLVDDKSYNGIVVAGRGHWQVGDRQVQNPVEKAEMVAKTAAAQLRDGAPGLGAALGRGYFLHAYVCLSGRVDFRPTNPDVTARVVVADQLAQALLGHDRLPAKRTLPIAEHREGIVDYLTAGRQEPLDVQPPEEPVRPQPGAGTDSAAVSTVADVPRVHRWLGYLSVGLFSLALAIALAAVALTDGTTPWQDVASQQDKRVWVKGPVVKVRRGDGVTYLNVGRDWPDSSRFTVRVKDTDVAAFAAHVGDVEAYYEGKTVAVFGTPEKSRNAKDPHMFATVTSPDDVRVVGVLRNPVTLLVLATALGLIGVSLAAFGWRRKSRVESSS